MTLAAAEDVGVLWVEGEPFGLGGDGGVATAVVESRTGGNCGGYDGVSCMVQFTRTSGLKIIDLGGRGQYTVAIASVRPVLH